MGWVLLNFEINNEKKPIQMKESKKILSKRRYENIPIRLPLSPKHPSHVIIRAPILPDGLGDAGQAINIGKTIINENSNTKVDIFLFAMDKNHSLIEKVIEGSNNGYPNLKFHIIKSDAVKYKMYRDEGPWSYDLPISEKMDGPRIFINEDVKKVLNNSDNKDLTRIVIDVPVPYITYEDDNLRDWGVDKNFIQLSEYGSGKRRKQFEEKSNHRLEYQLSYRKENLFKSLGLPTKNEDTIGIIIMPIEDNLSIKDISNKFMKNRFKMNMEDYRKNTVLTTCYSRSEYTQLNQLLCMCELNDSHNKVNNIDIILPKLLINFKDEQIIERLKETNIGEITLESENTEYNKVLFDNQYNNKESLIKIRFLQPGLMSQNDMKILQSEALNGIKVRNDIGLFSASGDGSITDILSMSFENSKSGQGIVFPIWEYRMNFHRNSIDAFLEIQKKNTKNPLLDELLKKLWSVNSENYSIQNNILPNYDIKRIKELVNHKRVCKDFLRVVEYIQRNFNAGQLSWVINDMLEKDKI